MAGDLTSSAGAACHLQQRRGRERLDAVITALRDDGDDRAASWHVDARCEGLSREDDLEEVGLEEPLDESLLQRQHAYG